MNTPQATGKPFTGRKALLTICSCFAVIIAVNFTLAYKAVATFPGSERSQKYIAGQGFDARRAAQEALGWDVAAVVQDDVLRLSFERDGTPLSPRIVSATLGRATSVAQDTTPDFEWDGRAYVAPVARGAGNWNLRLQAEAADGTPFQQRIVVKVVR